MTVPLQFYIATSIRLTENTYKAQTPDETSLSIYELNQPLDSSIIFPAQQDRRPFPDLPVCLPLQPNPPPYWLLYKPDNNRQSQITLQILTLSSS
ncbi:MAG: hypothetical protein ACTSYO_02580 [Candidatus Ranarchaeia archaeon]